MNWPKLFSRQPVEEIKQVKENKTEFVNRILPKQGHKCFEYNVLTHEMRYAKFNSTMVKYEDLVSGKGKPATAKKVLINENCMYVTALNFKNAIKHFEKILEDKITPVWVKG